MNINDFGQNIFNIPIWGMVLNHEKYHVSDYIDLIYQLQEKFPTVKKSNFGGWQSESDLHEQPVMREFNNGLLNIVKPLFDKYGLSDPEIIDQWANINYKYCNNAHHTHRGLISGVFYLQTPKECGRLVFVNPAIRGERSIFTPQHYGIDPEVISCILFPSWLQHYVEPNMSDDPRISISFNIGEKQ